MNYISCEKVEFLVVDECDKILQCTDTRSQVQNIFKSTPHNKQVMMFSATLSEQMRLNCRKLTRNPYEIYIDDSSKLFIYGLSQHYLNVSEEKDKNFKLFDILDEIQFNQIIIFVKNVERAESLTCIIKAGNFPTCCLHGKMDQDSRLCRLEEFKSFGKRILICTDLMERGIDINSVNVVLNYDLPIIGRNNERSVVAGSYRPSEDKFCHAVDQYLHRVGRAGRFGTRALAISFVSSTNDAAILNKVQERFSVDIKELT